MKRRVIGPNRRSYTGRHVGWEEEPNQIRYESGLERDFLTLIRFREGVLSIVEQPETFKFVDQDGQARRYTPDFKVIFRGKTVFYEIKYREELRKNWDRYKGAVQFMRRHCARNGAYFRIMTDLTVRSVQFENIKLVSPHLRNTPHPAMSEKLLALLRDGPITLLTAVRQLCPMQEDRADFYSALWPLVARREIHIDLTKPISMGSQLWV